jgi:hypothetical protein
MVGWAIGVELVGYMETLHHRIGYCIGVEY